MTELPPGWALAKLGDVCERAAKWDPRSRPEDVFDYIDISAIDAQRIQGPKELLGVDAPSRARQIVRAGDTLLSTVRTYLVNTALVPDELDGATASTGFCVLRPSRAIDNRYLFYNVVESGFVETLSRLQTGSSYPAVRDRDVFEQVIALPPLTEQRRIVAVIEEHLSRLDAAERLLRRVEVRAPALANAELTREIDDAGWPTVPLVDIAEFVTDGDHNPPPRVSAGIPHLTAKNVRRGGLSFAGCTFVSPEGYEQTRRRYDSRPGDVLVTCVGTIGESAVVPEGAVFSADRNLAAIRPSPRCDSTYLRLALSTPRRRRTMAMASGSTAQPHLYLRDLRALPIPLPPFAEQRRIVDEAEATQVRIGGVVEAAEEGQRRAVRLRRSILRAAFRGELVAHDATEEPAILLLERSAAERAASSAASRRRRVRTSA